MTTCLSQNEQFARLLHEYATALHNLDPAQIGSEPPTDFLMPEARPAAAAAIFLAMKLEDAIQANRNPPEEKP